MIQTIARQLRIALLGGVNVARSMGVTVGNDCRILSHNFGTEPWLITIGNRVTVTGGVHFVTHDGAGWLVRDSKGRRYRFACISIGDDVFLGLGTIILPGIQIGSKCIVGAGSVVTRSVPAGAVVAGNPARFICSYESLRRRIQQWPAEDETALQSKYRQETQRLASEFGFAPEMRLQDPLPGA